MTFRDHFSSVSERYAAFRPTYPPQLMQWLADHTPGKTECWDVGTGNGQIALQAAEHFDRVVATDASAAQIEHAVQHKRVEYRVEPAEAPSLPDASVDLVTVAAAIHWFDRPRFYRAVQRVSRPGGRLAAFSYGMEIADQPALNRVIQTFAQRILAPWWSDGHGLIVDRYTTLDVPFPTQPLPEVSAEVLCDLTGLSELLRTWSGAARMRQSTGADPIAPVRGELRAAWEQSGPDHELRRLRWPVFGFVAEL